MTFEQSPGPVGPEAVLEMIQRLIGFPTVSRDSNLDLIEFVSDYLAEFGIESQIVPNAEGTKANLYATIGPDGRDGVVLSGHTDVVPVDGQPWDSNPFEVRREGNRLFGRGSCDMKSFIGIALALVPEMLAAKLQRPIHFAFSYDEEVGCVGAPDMIARMAAELPECRAVIVGEPTMMKPVCAHKGMMGFETRVTGYEAHSSQTHRGVSAVMNAAKLIAFLGELAEEAQTKASERSFEPPYTTIHVGTVSGGTAMNIISRECGFVWDLRNIPEDDPQGYLARFDHYCNDIVLPAMRAVHPDCTITTEQRFSSPGLKPESDGKAEELVRVLTGHNAADVVSYGTEAGQFQEAGFSSVICGPGSIDQAHQPNEFIDIDQIESCTTMLRNLIAYQRG